MLLLSILLGKAMEVVVLSCLAKLNSVPLKTLLVLHKDNSQMHFLTVLYMHCKNVFRS